MEHANLLREGGAENSKRSVPHARAARRGRLGAAFADARRGLGRPRLRMLVRMQTQWGDVHKLYNSYPVSMFAELPLARCIRDPVRARAPR